MHKLKMMAVLSLLLLAFLPLKAQDSKTLYQGFLNPDQSSRPRVWWHWMNGNISKDGIYKDLHWMKRSGIVGFHNFDAGLETPQIVKKRLAYMTPEWKDAFHYMLEVADSLGMEVTIASSPGWSETGGPWVKDEDGMKKLVWRKVDILGGKKVRLTLPEGFDVTGQFQDYDIVKDAISSVFMKKKFYRDIAVVAVKVSDHDIPMAELHPAVTTSGGIVSLQQLTNDSVSDYCKVLPDKDGFSWIQFEYKKPQNIKSMVWSATSGDMPSHLYTDILCSNDGQNFKKIAEFGYQAAVEHTVNFPTTLSKYFRVRFKDTDNKALNNKIVVSKLVLSTVNQVEQVLDKGAFAFYRFANSIYTPATTDTVSLEDIVDVTKYVKDGILTWKAPKGRWRIYRFGYGLTGKTNHPASLEATGLEVDKMDPTAIRNYYKNFLQTYKDASQGLMGKKGIQYILNDSYEAGAQTWTPRMLEEFKARSGYDLLPWLPALTGLIIKSSDATDRFLFDWRMALGKMMSDYHYDMENDILKDYGLKRYTESHESRRANMTDGMDCKRYADVPMSAIWMRYNQKHISEPQFEADIRESASVAHIYGQNVAAAESFTTHGLRDGAFVYSPSVLKPTADAAMACGLNRFVIHTSPHQPVDDKIPGIGLGIYGQWFDRHETWANQAWAWTDYLSRSCYLLQQGKYVADVAYYYGEDTNITAMYQTNFVKFPSGYSFDFVSPSVLKEELKVENGQLVTSSGMKYNVLNLSHVERMSLSVLRKIAQFADAGITICGDKPGKLADLKDSETKFSQLVDKVWNSNRANVITGVAIDKVLAGKNIQPDVIFPEKSGNLRYVHRHLSDGDIYWVANQENSNKKVDVSFRVSGKKPQLWHADNGKTEDASYVMKDGRTSVSLPLTPYDAVFIIFVDDTKEQSAQLPTISESVVTELTSPWTVKFQENRGAPEQAIFNQLASLTESSDAGIKYFSGTATYSNTFKLDKSLFKKKNLPKQLLLDLGEVKDLAEVIVNGKNLGVVWKTPFKFDISSAVHPGENTLEVKVVNVWHNRLVGDEQPGVTKRITWTQLQFYKADEPLLKAGLLGPVKILQTR
jgi:hypothetical protein